MIIAIDFDGTIVYEAFPKIGKLKPNVVEMISCLYEEGHTIIIWTLRTAELETEMKKFLLDVGIPYHFINRNVPKECIKWNNDPRKIGADLFIDDRNLGGIPDDWEDIYKLINKT